MAAESEIWMSNMGSSLPSRGRKEDEGVAIPRCALMASSSLEELREFSGNYLFFGPSQRCFWRVSLASNPRTWKFSAACEASSRCPVAE